MLHYFVDVQKSTEDLHKTKLLTSAVILDLLCLNEYLKMILSVPMNKTLKEIWAIKIRHKNPPQKNLFIKTWISFKVNKYIYKNKTNHIFLPLFYDLGKFSVSNMDYKGKQSSYSWKTNILDHITSCQMIKSQHFLNWLTEILDFEQLKTPNKLHVIRAIEWFL